MNTIENIIKKLDLKKHPEGGYFKETYRSLGEIDKNNLHKNFGANRNYSTCIYFLLTSECFSVFHRIRQDEIWHFYDGSAILLHMISKTGIHTKITIGRDFSKEQVPQFVVPSGYWFAAKVKDKNNYSLVGCTVSPGFDFDDFELSTRKMLISKFPQHKKVITDFTHE